MERTRRGWMVALVGALTLWTVPAIAQVTISVDDATAAGGMATVNVSLASNGGSVGGMQNDIIFDNTKVQLANAQACRINAAIGLTPNGMDCMEDTSVGPCKNLSRVLNVCGGTPQAQGCPEGATSTTSVFRGIIAATAAPNNNPIPDGVLYTCTFAVTTTPADLDNNNVVVSNPTGTRLDSVGDDGVISGEGGGPTPTPTTGGEPCPPTATVPTGGNVAIKVGDVVLASGVTTADVAVSLVSNGGSVGGMQNDIIFDNTKVQLANAQACRINAAIGLMPNGMDCMEDTSVGPCKNLSRVLNVCGGTPQAQGCPATATSTTSVFRGIIAATAAPNNNPIPDGVLYTCTFTVASTAALDNNNVVVSNPTGTRLDSVAVDGSICAAGGGDNTPTPVVSPTNTPPTVVVPTNTPPTVVANTPTRTHTAGPTNTPIGPTITPTRRTDGECESTLALPATTGSLFLTLVDGDCFPEEGGVVLINGLFTIGYANREGDVLNLVTPLNQTFTVGSTVRLARGGGDDDDGCHIQAKATNSNAWMLLIPALGLLAIRRKR